MHDVQPFFPVQALLHAVGAVDAVRGVGAAVLSVGVRDGLRVVYVAAKKAPVVSVLVVNFWRVLGVRVCPGLVAVWAPIVAVGIHEPVGLVRAARAVGIVQAVLIIGTAGGKA